MPIKTNFLELEKLQGHENYNGDIDNSNLDKLDAVVKNHEDRTKELEDKIDKKEQLSVELKPEKKVVSVRDSFGGACGFEVEGALVENLVKNGDFSAGVNRWSSVGYGKLSSNNLELIQTLESDDLHSACRVEQSINNAIPGNKYFIFGEILPLYAVTAHLSYGDDSSHYITTVPNRWNEVYGIVTAITNTRYKFYHNTSAGYSIGDEIKRRNIFIINMTASGIEDYTDEQMLAICRAGYFEGLQPLRGVAVEGVGKNLFDKKTIVERGERINQAVAKEIDTGVEVSSVNPTAFGRIKISIQGKPNTQYTVGRSLEVTGILGDLDARLAVDLPRELAVADIRHNNLNFTTATFTTDETGIMDVYLLSTGSDAKIVTAKFKEIILVEGHTIDKYTPHTSSKIVLNGQLAKLPNGAADKIVRENGKTIKYAHTNVGRDGVFYKINETDSFDIYSNAFVTALRFRLSNLNLPDGFFSKAEGRVIVSGYSEIRKSWSTVVADDVGFVNTLSGGSFLDFLFPLGTSLSDGKNSLLNLKIAYQIETPQIINLSDKTEPLNSYEGYTQFSVEDGVVKGERFVFGISETYGGSGYFNYIGGDTNIPKVPNLKFKLKKMIRVISVKNGIEKDVTGVVVTRSDTLDNAFNGIYFTISAEDYDIDADYYMTYTTSETNGQANVKLSYNADMSSTVSSNSSTINIIGEQTDHNSRAINKLNEPSVWVEPTLLNNTINYGAQYLPLQYAIKNGICKVRGTIRTNGLVKVAKLPIPRSRKTEIFVCDRANAHGRCWVDDKGELTVVEGDVTLSFQYEI